VSGRSGLGRVVRSGVGRRRVQTVVVGLVVMIAVAASVLGGTLLVASHTPFDRAFAQQHGAHLTARFDPAKATTEQLAASARAAGVVAAAGPFRTVTATPVDGRGHEMPAVTLVGRAGPGGPVDAVTLVTGRWASGPGELVVLEGRWPEEKQFRLGALTLTVVGTARSVSGTADGWVSPDQATAFPGPATYQMLYRFAPAGTAADIDTGRAAVEATLPAGAMAGSRSWLTTRADAADDTALFVPFLLAFGGLGLVMAVLIVGNVIAGAVATGTRRIGVLKALGFTPAQVVRAYLGQALIPATVGAVLGVVVGNLIAAPVLVLTNDIYDTSDGGVVWWVDAAVPAVLLALVAVTAWAAASRAGRLRTVDALAVGRTPTPGRGRWAARLTARLPLPRPVTLGLAQPFARPVRSATIVAAIAFGAAAVTFAVGLASTLTEVQKSDIHEDVRVTGGGPDAGPGATTLDPAVAAAISAQPGTGGYCGVASTGATTAAITETLEVIATTGGGCSHGYRMVAGSWYGGPGEIVVATPFLTATGAKVGGTVTLAGPGDPVTVRIVGEVFNAEHDGLQILTAAATFTGADVRPTAYRITVRPGTDVDAYSRDLDVALTPLGARTADLGQRVGGPVLVINALASLLTLLLGAVAALGVLNTVVLETRERVHDLGVHKALGMAPRQTVAMVIASVVVTGVVGGALGTGVGTVLHRLVVTDMGDTVGLTLPPSVIDIYGAGELVLFGLAGVVIAVVGALLPAGWAARTRTATALRTE
jgi:putative ABC transport system permease protein